VEKYNPEDFWERRYERFDISSSGHIDLPHDYNIWLYKMKASKIAKAIHGEKEGVEDKNILELGCGTGAYLDLWKKLGLRTVTGVDISPSSANILNQKFSEWNFHCHDISAASLLDILGRKKYDVVTAIGVLVHIVDDEKMKWALENISNLVTNDGLVLISDYTLSGDQPSVDHGYMKFRNFEEFKGNLNQVGLKFVSTLPFYYFMIAPFDTPSIIERIFLEKSHFFFRKFIRKFPKLAGRFLYSLDKIITPLLANGPSEELFVCIKK